MMTDPHATDPSATDPSATDPSATDPSATVPSVLDPHARAVETDPAAGGPSSPPSYPLEHHQPAPVPVPRVLRDLRPVGGVIRVEPEDFQVTEIPLYEAAGTGEHLYATLTKRNRTTLQVADYLARELRIDKASIGFAGFKDRRAVTTQTFSIQGVRAEDVRPLETDWLRIERLTYHMNKLRTGHLAGNRFCIRARGVEPGALERARAIVARLRAIGMPNWYGAQRFGRFGNGHEVGRALLHRDPRRVLDLLLAPRADAPEEFRVHYAAGRHAEALAALPTGRPIEAGLLHALRRLQGNHRAAARRIPREMRRMYFSAFQSHLFNWCLRERLAWGEDAFSRIEPGDLAFIHRKGACFRVTADELAATRARAATGELAPSGPMFGRKMIWPEGREGALERAVLEAEGLRPQSFLSHTKGIQLDGARRPYCVELTEAEVEAEAEDVLVFRFALPPGSFATVLLEEVMGEGATRPPDPEG